MKGRVALITGAGQGIGRAIALALAEAGARVVLAARSLDKLEAVAAEIRAAGGEAHVVQLDLGSLESIQAAFKKTEAEVGPVEILVNNGAVTRDGIAMRMSFEHWAEVLQTNLTGAFQCIQQALRPMAKARWGRIINVSSVVAQSGNPGQANYVSAKAGLIGLTKSLAIEMAPRNITVNAVAPGFIETAMTDVLNDDQRVAVMQRIPLARIGKPEEVAAAVRFLASDEASYITGHVLNVNGGMYM
jgi:3-oxoacyl-[acyl-carrier protein] reductase